MEARLFRALLWTTLVVLSTGANYETANFIIETRDPNLAKQFGEAAERYRHDLAIQWLGEPMLDWYRRCRITCQVGPGLGAGGATTFQFENGEVGNWRMSIQGSAERILDSVLPHEITHMIYASHFRQAVPRWADEGGATSVEHISERQRHRDMLLGFLRNNRGIAFNDLFAMTEYPDDIMPLYAEGYALADFLIQRGGHRRYVQFIGDGLDGDRWTEAVQRNYGYSSLGHLQNAWVAWVAQGFPRLESSDIQLAAHERVSPPSRQRAQPADLPVAAATAPRPDQLASARTPVYTRDDHDVTWVGTPRGPSLRWYAPVDKSTTPEVDPVAVAEAKVEAVLSQAAATRVQMAHPQMPEKARQIILE